MPSGGHSAPRALTVFDASLETPTYLPSNAVVDAVAFCHTNVQGQVLLPPAPLNSPLMVPWGSICASIRAESGHRISATPCGLTVPTHGRSPEVRRTPFVIVSGGGGWRGRG
jgi:hypothetical protein